MKKINGKSRNTIYLSPSMKFNPGIMAYEPNISNKIKNKKIPKKEKLKIAILSALLIILLILILLYSWYKLG